MKPLRTHVAGVDVQKEILEITVLIGDADKEPAVTQLTYNTLTEDLMACGSKLLELGVHEVAMESSGVDWKPLHSLWSRMNLSLTIGPDGHMKSVPGRKADMNDSHWIAQLHRCGLIKASFIPDEEYQLIQLLSCHRTDWAEDLSRCKKRIQDILEDGHIKYSSIVPNVFDKSGIQILRLLAEGVTDASLLFSKVATQVGHKENVRKSLTNCFTQAHCYVIAQLMGQYDDLQEQILSVENKLAEKVKPYAHLVEKLKEIPDINDILAKHQ